MVQVILVDSPRSGPTASAQQHRDCVWSGLINLELACETTVLTHPLRKQYLSHRLTSRPHRESEFRSRNAPSHCKLPLYRIILCRHSDRSSLPPRRSQTPRNPALFPARTLPHRSVRDSSRAARVQTLVHRNIASLQILYVVQVVCFDD